MAEPQAKRLDLQELLRNSKIALPVITKRIKRHQIHEVNSGRKYYGEYHHLFPLLKMYPEKFQQYVKMKPSTFDYLLLQTKHALSKNWCNLHTQPILEEERLVLTLRFFATGSSYTHLAFSFRMGVSTVSTIIEETMDIVWNELQPIHMPIPTVQHFRDIADGFNSKWNFPHCIGAIDGRHIQIKKPKNSGSLYYNYKHYFSVVQQAVVDANHRYVAIDVGGYGSQSDAGTFKASCLFKCLATKKLRIPKEDELPKSRIILPYFLIGDGAYPLMENVMKPYPLRNLSTNEKTFNRRLSGARAVVENAFGYTCQKWRIFYTMIDKSPKVVISITQCACILHNMIIDLENEDISVSLTKERGQVPIGKICTPSAQRTDFQIGLGKEVREELTKYLMKNPLK